MLSKIENKIFVMLASCSDEDRMWDIKSSQCFDELAKPNGSCYFEVSSIKEAIALCESFIKQFNLGSSNWMGGRVVNNEMNFIAHVSYNSRVWDNENWELAKEIIL